MRECDFGLLTFFLATMYEGISVDLSRRKHLTIIFYKIRFNIILSYCVTFHLTPFLPNIIVSHEYFLKIFFFFLFSSGGSLCLGPPNISVLL